MSGNQDNADVEAIEIRLLLDGVHLRYGFDFREYAFEPMRRQIGILVRTEEVGTISGLQHKVLRDSGCLYRLVSALAVSVTSMFRDPNFYSALREKVVPLLRTYPFVRLWHAGCSTGEEAYSMAILMHEEGLYERCRIYATDMNPVALKRASRGIVPLAQMKEYTDNYLKAGGKSSLSDYYTAGGHHAVFNQSLKRRIIFAQHNLVTDRSFNEFNLILCRNVLIYFQQPLQARVFNLLDESLGMFGILALGNGESFPHRVRDHESAYEEIDRREKLFRKVS